MRTKGAVSFLKRRFRTAVSRVGETVFRKRKNNLRQQNGSAGSALLKWRFIFAVSGVAKTAFGMGGKEARMGNLLSGYKRLKDRIIKLNARNFGEKGGSLSAKRCIFAA